MRRWKSTDLELISESFQKFLRMTTYAVGVKMLSSSSELGKILKDNPLVEDIAKSSFGNPSSNKILTICQPLSKAIHWCLPTHYRILWATASSSYKRKSN